MPLIDHLGILNFETSSFNHTHGGGRMGDWQMLLRKIKKSHSLHKNDGRTKEVKKEELEGKKRVDELWS